MDRANGSWILQSSPDLITWTDVGNPFFIRNSFQPLAERPKAGLKLYYRLSETSFMAYHSTAFMLDLPPAPYPYATKSSASMKMAGAGLNVTLSDKTVLLGRVLFYDRRLSKDNSISCSSCHLQENAFADKVAFSRGHLGGLTARNAAPPTDLPSYSTTDGRVFWDGRSRSLSSAVLEPISHAVEMGLSQEELVAKLSLEPYYTELFTSAYGTADVTAAKIGTALAQFCNAIPRFDAKYDQARLGTATLTASEQEGSTLFSSKCMTCHTLTGAPRTPFANNGLDLVYADQGVAIQTGLTADRGKFKIPNLRQVSQTGPYMHDGRFKTLRQVIDHYSEGIKNHPNLSSPLRSTGPMHFTEEQKQALEDFLKTLTDPEIATNPAFADPFRKN
ncbi:cytochrome c peroxidase [Haloferula sp. BvORR071]|uniref:cytochrome-c peroxidase n=1 Tax=Haloferula sp. BvORR071 TaxID=1396141 RepID=UPI000697FCA9|nr:cytochrome c peroxidase [Haloferula sp. BvORR071]